MAGAPRTGKDAGLALADPRTVVFARRTVVFLHGAIRVQVSEIPHDREYRNPRYSTVEAVVFPQGTR